MNLKKFNLYQTSGGVMQNIYIGTVYAESFHRTGHAAIFQIGDKVVCIMNFVRVEECLTDED